MKLKSLVAAVATLFNGTGTGIGRRIAYKVETTAGTRESGAGAQVLRRTSFGIIGEKETNQSEEKLSHYQDADVRHGFARVAGPINGQLSPGTYADFLDALLRRARTAVSAMTGLSITIAASGSEYTITRGSGSFLTDGVKKGMVVRLTAGSFNSNNLNKNIVVRTVTATVITGFPLNSEHTLTAEGPIASATVSVPGKVSFVPTTGHTSKSFTIEDYHAGVTGTPSETFYGCKVVSAAIGVPANGMCTIALQFLGRYWYNASAENFTSPAAETTTGLVNGISGVIIFNDTKDSVLSINVNINGAVTSEPEVGLKFASEVFQDKVMATGDFSAMWDDVTFRNAFTDETTAGLVIILPSSGDANADFVSIIMPKVKLLSAGKDDPNTDIHQSVQFKALYNSAGGSGIATEQTTIMYQDSAAS